MSDHMQRIMEMLMERRPETREIIIARWRRLEGDFLAKPMVRQMATEALAVLGASREPGEEG